MIGSQATAPRRPRAAPRRTTRTERCALARATLGQTLNRLARMSPDELRHRAVVAARRRLGPVSWLAAVANRDDPWVRRVAADPATRAALPALLARVLGERLYGRDWSPARLAESLRAAGAAGRIVAEAEQIRARRLSVLGYGARDLGRPIDWHRDPVSGGRWQRRYGGAPARGDRAQSGRAARRGGGRGAA